MSNFPEDVVVQSGVTYLKPETKAVLGADDIAVMLNDLDEARRALWSVWFPDPVTFGPARVPVTETNHGGGLYSLGIPALSGKFHGTQDGYLHTLDRDAPDWFEWSVGDVTEYGLHTVPYARAAGISYKAGVKAGFYPASPPTASKGVIAFKRYVRAFGGDLGTPDAVVDNGDGTMTFTLTNRVAAGAAWVADAAIGRKVVIWKLQPSVAGAEAIWSGVALSDGAVVTADVTHAFGQLAPSTDAADYFVMPLGIHIAPAAGWDDDEMWTLLEVTDGTIDLTTQTLASLPGTVSLDLWQMAQDLYFDPAAALDGDGNANFSEPLQQLALRLEARWEARRAANPQAAIWKGSLANTLAVNEGVVVDDTGDPITFTFPAMTGDWWTFSRRFGITRPSSVLNFDQAEGANTYVIYLSYTEIEQIGGPNYVSVELAYTTEAGWNGSADDTLPMLKFDYDGVGGAGSVTNVERSDLGQFRGQALWGSGRYGRADEGEDLQVSDIVWYPGDTDPWTAEKAKLRMRATTQSAGLPPLFEVFGFDETTDVGAADANAIADLYQDANDVWLRIFGPAGRGGLGGSPKQRAILGLGSDGEGLIIQQVGSVSGESSQTIDISRAVAKGTRLFQFLQEFGQQADTINSKRPMMVMGDWQLEGSDGKVVTWGLEIGEYPRILQNTNPAGWVWDNTLGLWKNNDSVNGDDDVLYFPIPHSKVGGRLSAGSGGSDSSTGRLVRVRMRGGFRTLGDSGSFLKGQLVEVDPTNANPFTAVGGGGGLTEIGTEVSWLNVSPVEKDIDVTGATTDSIPVGREMDPSKRYFVRCTAGSTVGGGTPLNVIEYFKVVTRVYEAGQ